MRVESSKWMGPRKFRLLRTQRRLARAQNFYCVAAAALILGIALPTGAQDTDRAALEQQQKQANGKAGARSTPLRLIPVPEDLDLATAALVGAPYSTFWNLNPPDDAGWRAIVARAAEATIPKLAQQRVALGVSMTATRMGGVREYLLTPRVIPVAHRNQIIFHIHGGGYIFGPGEAGTGEAMLMAAYGGYKVLSVDYRMPPGAPYPAAMDDVTAAWRALVATTDPRRIAVEGTSTGGGMTLALMLRAKTEGLPLPAAIAPGSPWSDMTGAGDSYKTNEWIDNVVVSYDGYLSRVARLYAHGHDLKDPQLSPVYGDLHGLPPAILTAGTRDLFLSNTVRVQRKLREAGIEADLELYEGLSHAQFNVDATAPVTKEAYGEITRFFDAHLAR